VVEKAKPAHERGKEKGEELRARIITFRTERSERTKHKKWGRLFLIKSGIASRWGGGERKESQTDRPESIAILVPVPRGEEK